MAKELLVRKEDEDRPLRFASLLMIKIAPSSFSTLNLSIVPDCMSVLERSRRIKFANKVG